MEKKVILQECWIWKDEVTAFVKDKIKGHSLNVCAGKNPLCNENIDLDPQHPKVSQGDMRLIPFKSNTFDTVVSDPPWKIGYYQRFRPFFECVRVCKIGGRIIYNAYWIPESEDVKLIKTYVRQDTTYSNTSIISIYEKIGHNKEYAQKREGELQQQKLKES